MRGDVVDINVLRTANGEADHASIDCRIAAIDYLLDCREKGKIVLDGRYIIMSLYSLACSRSGQPGAGDEFFRWLHENIASIRKAHFDTDEQGNHSTYPDHADLKTFDWDDRIYVATALATTPASRLVNAVDSDYSEHNAAFQECGLEVVELCPECLH